MFGPIKLNQGSLPVGYRLNQPRLSPAAEPETPLPRKAPQHAVEVVSTSTGRRHSGETSRLCKTEMFRLFADTWNRLNPDQALPSAYVDMKKMAYDYQTANITLYNQW